MKYNPSTPPDLQNIVLMDVVRSHCHARKWKKESSGICCLNDKIRLKTLERPPSPMDELLIGETADSQHYLKHIRQYNSLFQMTSIGCQEIKLRGWNQNFRIQGQMTHSIGSLNPLPDKRPKFAQIFFLGNNEVEVDTRATIFSGLRRAIIEDIQTILHEVNSYVISFKMAKDFLDVHSDTFKVVIHANRKPSGQQERRLNAPTTNGVAVLMLSEECGKRDIVLRRQDSSLRRIAETHRSYDALQYPLIFPRGEDGYSFSDTHVRSHKKVSAMRFYAFHLMVREENFNTLLRYQNLMQQFW